MKITLFILVGTGLLIGSAIGQGVPAPGTPPKYKADPLEIAQLPPYCYKQYVDGSLTVPYAIPIECGYEMNHFCGALVSLIQAKKSSWSRTERRGAVENAIKEIRYTQRGMLPGCPIKADVEAAMVRAQTWERMLK